MSNTIRITIRVELTELDEKGNRVGETQPGGSYHTFHAPFPNDIEEREAIKHTLNRYLECLR